MAGNSNKASQKKQLIDKANSRIVLFTSAASFIVIFSLVAAYTLLGQMAYQHRVIDAKQTALDQLETDIDNTEGLMNAYEAFESTDQNIIGGSTTGAGNRDGDNARIVLDALPSQYDFPGLVASLEKILTSQGVVIESISGDDDQINQTNSAASDPAPVEMTFEVSVSGNYDAIKKVVDSFSRSIRPIQIDILQINGSEDKMTMNVSATTYYQPAKSLNIKKEVVE